MVEEYCWAITFGGGGSAAADRVPVCWEFGSQLFVVPACTVDHM